MSDTMQTKFCIACVVVLLSVWESRNKLEAVSNAQNCARWPTDLTLGNRNKSETSVLSLCCIDSYLYSRSDTLITDIQNINLNFETLRPTDKWYRIMETLSGSLIFALKTMDSK